MKLLLDGDILCYRCAASSENEESWIALSRLDQLIKSIQQATGIEEYKVFLTGSNNFRATIYPAYKANRVGKPKPKWLEACREYLVLEHDATVSDGNEADDNIAIEHTKLQTLICSIDKDFYQLPGDHYNFVTKEQRYISEESANRYFFRQMLLGDRADNIPGFDGKMRDKFPQKFAWIEAALEDCKTYKEMFQLVRYMYEDDERFLLSGACLYLQREEGEDWRKSAQNLMAELGRWEDIELSSRPSSDQEPDDGPQSLKP